jgi:hypothetical protein
MRLKPDAAVKDPYATICRNEQAGKNLEKTV